MYPVKFVVFNVRNHFTG